MKPSYLPRHLLREEPISAPSELEVQALWFEQYHQSILTTDDGRTVEVIQPGFWNHSGGPDFTQAALRFRKDGAEEVVIGNVEVHLRPADWSVHGHDADPAYEGTILHVVWENRSAKSFFPATASFRRIPQIVLSSQLIAPWPELQPLCASLLHTPRPTSTPGRCSPILEGLPAERLLEILRAAGLFRLRQKAQRWFWRRRLTGPEQSLYEALAEALGFHANQIPMRLVAQRLPWSKLRGFDHETRLAHLFGLSGFLPKESTAKLQAEPKAWLRNLWEIWWKEQDALDYAQLPKTQWKLAGLRPLNRPERRLAALAQIIPRIPDLVGALLQKEADRFAAILAAIRDPFWEKHATLSGSPLSTPCRLIGKERIEDIMLNIFWPMVSLEDAEGARKGFSEIKASSNSAARIASQRMLISALSPKQAREALVQQGLLQVFRDYCQTDCSRCQNCTFPELARTWIP